MAKNEADARRVVERDLREFACGGDHQQLVPDLEGPPKRT
jgi:hypothetical protein